MAYCSVGGDADGTCSSAGEESLWLAGGRFGPNGSYGQGGAASVQNGPRMNVFGNETRLGRKEKRQEAMPGKGNGAGGSDYQAQSAFDAVDVLDKIDDREQSSEAISVESALEQYGDVVDEYFEAITEER